MLAALVLPTLFSAIPSEHAATQADLKSWNTYLSSVAAASVANIPGQCKTNYDAWLAARVTYGCTTSDLAETCATLGTVHTAGSTDDLKYKACCRDLSGVDPGTISGATWVDAALTGTWAQCTGDTNDCSPPKNINKRCETYTGAVNPGWADYKKQCCSTCADSSSANYPFMCTKASFTKVSVCKSEKNTEGNAPLPVGFKCSTSPTHGSSATYEVSNTNYPVPTSCAKLKADRTAGVTGATVWASLEGAEHSNEVPNNDYGKMRRGGNFMERAVLAGGEFLFKNQMGCGIFLEATVGAGGKFGCRDGTANAPITAATTSNMELFLYKPTVLASAAKSVFEMGSVYVIGGSNAGEIEVNQYAGSAKLQGLVNTGTVTSTSAKDIFICDTTNQAAGSVTVSASTAVLVNVTNSGTVSVSGGTFSLYDVTNAAGGTVTVGGAVTAMASGITNAGTISITGGTIDVTLATNAGGTITIATGVTGTLTLASGGDPGTYTVPATVTTVGFNGNAAPPAPRAPPSPAMPPPVVGAPVYRITTSFSLSGSVSDYGQKAQGAIKAVLASEANVSTAAVVLTITAGSVIVSSDIFVESQAAAEEKAAALVSGVLQNATTLTKALTQQFTADGVVTASPLQVEAINTKPSAVSSTFGGGGCGAGCVGGIIGGVFGVCVILGCVLFQRARKVEPKAAAYAPGQAPPA